MSGDPFSDTRILESWGRNAAPWITAVREQQIESRRLVTDQAIVDAVLDRSPRSVLDLGCGEGWLVRALAANDVSVIGIDAIPALVEQARLAGGGDFRVASYEELASAPGICVDAVVCNFSLLGDASVAHLFDILPALLQSRGSLLVQTLHPLMACGEQPYRDGWRPGSWAGFNADFSDPAPWYFRTLESWLRLFSVHGFRLLELREPLHPQTGKPASVIFIATLDS